MTTIFISYLFPLFFFKSSFFLSFSFLFDDCMIFFFMIFPLVFFLIWKVFFNFSLDSDEVVYKFIFFFLFLLLFFGLGSVFPFFFIVGVEICSVFMIIFLFHFSKDHDKISSAIFMFFINMLGSIPFFFFCSAFDFFKFSGSSLFSVDSFFLFLCFSLILVSKLPIFFFHFWLTKAHVSASGSGSMILASIMLKIGSVGLMKWSFLFFSMVNFIFFYIVSFSIFCSCILLIVMNRFFDLKYLVACSSVIHMSFIFPFFLFSSPSMFGSSLGMMVSHGVVSCIIFFLVTLVYEFSYDRSSSFNKSLESIYPSLVFFLLVWFILNLGFPPFLSFMSEVFFCFSVFSIDSLFFPSFFLILLFSGLFFIHLCLNFLFSKKNFLFNSGYSIFLNVVNFASIKLFILLSLFFF